MTDSESPLDKNELIDRILTIELEWFLSVNPTVTSECQRNPEAFKLLMAQDAESIAKLNAMKLPGVQVLAPGEPLEVSFR